MSGSSGGGTTASSDPETQRRLLREVQRRTDLVSYALLAEINQFHRDHVLCQMSGHVRQLLRNQIEFHRKVSGIYNEDIQFCYLNYEGIRTNNKFHYFVVKIISIFILM